MGNEEQSFHYDSIALLILLLYVKVKITHSENSDHFYIFFSPYSPCSCWFYFSVVVIWPLKQNVASKFVTSLPSSFRYNASKSLSAWCCNESDDFNKSESKRGHIYF